MTPAHGTLRLFDDAAALAREGAAWLLDQAVASSGRFVVALSGGSTPKALYRHFAEEPAKSRMPWDRTHWAIGDERFVDARDPASNFGMVCDTFLSHVPVPAPNLHRVPTDGVTLAEAVDRYETNLKSLYGADTLDPARPLFDVQFLGLGDDGHTASLIPGQPAVHEITRWVAGVPHGRGEERITLTYPAINSSRHAVFLVSGEGKRAVLDRVLSGDMTLPAAHVRPVGEVHWFADRAAAGRWAG